MALSQLSSLQSSYPAATTLVQAQAWLQNALNLLASGADIAQTTAVLHHVEKQLDTIARTTGPEYIRPSSNPSHIRSGFRTGRGDRHQDQPNEDTLFAIQGVLPSALNPPFGLFVIADGMGSSVNGQTASSIVILQLVDIVLRRLMEGETEFHSLLMEGIRGAHQAIQCYNRQGKGMTMGALATVALVFEHTAIVANIGDCRTYLYSASNGLQQITKDHSLVALMASMRLIEAEDIYDHPLRNQVYRTLGTLTNPEIDLFTISLQDGDKLLLCSDGLWTMVRDREIEHLLRSPLKKPAATANALYEAAVEAGSVDNISAVVVEYGFPPTEMHNWL